ncbi:DUF3742 family protein [Pseudomonas batumici]|uniref:DUF3742 family protein n=1 Tax=Pseudomonas batumici TaxID=226910 RepID=UPI0030D5A42F
MDETKNQGFAYRLGYRLGRLQGACRRIETTLVGWFKKKGIPPMATRSVRWIVKLAVAGLLLYLAFWIALFVLGALAIANAAAIAPDQEIPTGDSDGWRHGHSGFGDYIDDYRVDPGRFDND